nr:unnamed protein product [Callosobruchus analis]
MVAMLKSQNRIFGNSSDWKVLKVWPTKKRGEIYQALLEVDCATYSGLLGQGSVLVNVDNCVVYDALGLKICFKCCGLNHYAKDCKKSEQICIKCAGNHKRMVSSPPFMTFMRPLSPFSTPAGMRIADRLWGKDILSMKYSTPGTPWTSTSTLVTLSGSKVTSSARMTLHRPPSSSSVMFAKNSSMFGLVVRYIRPPLTTIVMPGVLRVACPKSSSI